MYLHFIFPVWGRPRPTKNGETDRKFSSYRARARKRGGKSIIYTHNPFFTPIYCPISHKKFSNEMYLKWFWTCNALRCIAKANTGKIHLNSHLKNVHTHANKNIKSFLNKNLLITQEVLTPRLKSSLNNKQQQKDPKGI